MTCCDKVEQKLFRLKRKIEEIERNILHTVFPRDPTLFYQELSTAKHKNKLLELKNKKRILNQDQCDLVVPFKPTNQLRTFRCNLIGDPFTKCMRFQDKWYLKYIKKLDFVQLACQLSNFT